MDEKTSTRVAALQLAATEAIPEDHQGTIDALRDSQKDVLELCKIAAGMNAEIERLRRENAALDVLAGMSDERLGAYAAARRSR